jgi:DNA helicase IV
VKVYPEIFCTGPSRHAKTFANIRGDHCYCGNAWEDEMVALRNAQVATVQERMRSGELSTHEAKYLNALERDYLAASDLAVPELSADLQLAIRTAFVAEWATRFQLTPDDDQAAAIATGWRDAIVEARAGSGKTRTIIGRTLFLIDKCGIPPDAIIILAFNTRAAQELKDRLRTYGLQSLPHVMTFHALARRIVEPVDQIIFDSSDDASDAGQEQSRVVDDIARDFFSTEQGEQRVRDLLRHRFKKDDARADAELLFRTKEDAVSARMQVPLLTLNGERVKSYGEQQIANLLFRNDVNYHYERALPIRINGAVYRPDFTIPPQESGGKTVVIEYFGMQGNAGYDRLSADKRAFWKTQDPARYGFLEFSPSDVVADPQFSQRLLSGLRSFGIRSKELPTDVVWSRMKEKGAILSISRALRDFVQQARKRGWDVATAREAIDAHQVLPGVPGELERSFLQLAVDVLGQYLNALDAKGKIDFDELLNRAVTAVSEGRTGFCGTREDKPGNLRSIRAVLVDEFQDFNMQFEALLAAGRRQMTGPTFFAVGDPWQAINAFAGASTAYFESFPTDYPGAVHHVIATNYRSARAVVQVGNAIMQDRAETPARPFAPREGKVRLFDGANIPPDRSARENGEGSTLDLQAKTRLVRAASRLVPDDGRLFVLSRTESAVSDVRRAMVGHLSKDELRRTMFSTVHQAKGLEAEYVVLIDGGAGMFPLIHPNWVFSRIFGANIDDIVRDEQNLLYVAITRASTEAWVLLPDGERSDFLPGVGSSGGVSGGNWSDAPALSTYGKARVAVSGYERRDELKALGFVFEADSKQWCIYVETVPDGVAILSKVTAHVDLRATISDAASEEQRSFTHHNWPRIRHASA